MFIIRGLPGSGKSTLANMLAANPDNVCCSDDYLYVGEQYVFTVERHQSAKEQSFRKFMSLIGRGVETVCFTGVSPNRIEANRYAEAAEAAGYKVFWLVVENLHGGQSIHDVPIETMRGMRHGFEVQL
jgi:hypothetical protein